jgi:putative transposase
MRQLNGVYTQAHNRAHGRVGHVFQGRFKAIIVQREAYLPELARYVVLNPVRAGGGLPSVWDSLQDQLYLGDAAFADALRQSAQSPTNPNEIPRIQRRATAQPLAHFVAMPHRNSAIAQAHATGCYSLKQIAEAFGLHYATISRIVKAAETAQLDTEQDKML